MSRDATQDSGAAVVLDSVQCLENITNLLKASLKGFRSPGAPLPVPLLAGAGSGGPGISNFLAAPGWFWRYFKESLYAVARRPE